MSLAAVGGVMPAEPAGTAVAGSVWDAWRGTSRHHAAFASGRAALAALLAARRVETAWLPAYGCPSLAQGAAAGASAVRYYGVSAELEHADERWTAELGGGDAVIVIDYFGRPPGAAWRSLRATRPDVLWIEDRAQALDTAAAPFGDVQLFSPRKLLGVGDGGLLFADQPLPQPTGPGDDRLWAAEDARAADRDGLAPETWRPQFLAREAQVGVAPAGASARTLAALRSTPLSPISEQRRANWRILATALPDHALWPDLDPAFAPLSFPILAEDAAEAVRALALDRIWAPRHWADPPSDPAVFRQAHNLARRLVSLPCDQRYGAPEMRRIAEAVRARVRPAGRPNSRSPPPGPRSRRG